MSDPLPPSQLQSVDARLEASDAASIDDNSDADSTLETGSLLSSTASVESSVLKYREENGRTYHGFKPNIDYVLPNDATEQDRLDLQHNLFMLTFGGRLVLSPPGEKDANPGRVLDVGTGTGIWAMDFGDEHPEAEVLGVDLSPIQPAFVPPNVSFQIDDVESEWTYNSKFNFIFGRMLVGSISDWPAFIQRSYDNLEPGGWMELQDITFPVECDDGSMKSDAAVKKWSDTMLQATSAIQRYGDSPKRYQQQMIDAGFVNVRQVIYKWPTNPWPKDPKYKELGAWCYENIAGSLSGLSMALFTRGLGWDATDVEMFLVDVRKSMRDKNVHAWWPIYVVYGQKPPGPDAAAAE
ncbi:S-adenosyl-L-methionine-dependent methyltransferase [Plectosphaerella plurivora]|uniref:S-adenosyl-L-methionine-dependent methyltransferase n=1 Tax=Plectosphaerella plurivora TaxID=936078 RepID=A0A9P9A8E1_9PEZI|nr:S-adenosyl-L-methionine-dependent methyltransferase [Plectosphaerella plurivora]